MDHSGHALIVTAGIAKRKNEARRISRFTKSGNSDLATGIPRAFQPRCRRARRSSPKDALLKQVVDHFAGLQRGDGTPRGIDKVETAIDPQDVEHRVMQIGGSQRAVFGHLAQPIGRAD